MSILFTVVSVLFLITAFFVLIYFVCKSEEEHNKNRDAFEDDYKKWAEMEVKRIIDNDNQKKLFQ